MILFHEYQETSHEAQCGSNSLTSTRWGWHCCIKRHRRWKTWHLCYTGWLWVWCHQSEMIHSQCSRMARFWNWFWISVNNKNRSDIKSLGVSPDRDLPMGTNSCLFFRDNTIYLFIFLLRHLIGLWCRSVPFSVLLCGWCTSRWSHNQGHFILTLNKDKLTCHFCSTEIIITSKRNCTRKQRGMNY